ncbi:methyltransferase type 12 [Candidatus Vecturithrix granuli]|uniref:Methyltransferase type 12 n=1 Tax=Vecturithrix granuli TaxID=1499967 RepID=A0A081BXU9_VECG1|nr:methyltransferase type 12 [Candidatus Vecturithrix granuli]
MWEQYKHYACQYQRMLNQPPDWAAAESTPEQFACRKPWLPKNKEARILDFGCGWGHQLMALWCAGYHYLEGVELVADQAKICQTAIAGRFEVHYMDGCDFLQGKESVYDLIIMNDVIEHISVDKIATVLHVVYQALVPNGSIVLRTPNMSSLLCAYSRYLDFTHLTGYTEFSLRQLLDLIGFEKHQLVPDQWGWHPGAWRPWVPWRGLGLKGFFNHFIHKTLYYLRGQNPKPTVFGYNIEIYSHKPAS